MKESTFSLGIVRHFTHIVYLDSHICTKIKLIDKTPVGFNKEADNCHRLSASPLNKQQHPGCSYTDRNNARHNWDNAVPVVNGTIEQNSNPGMKNVSEPKYAATNATSVEFHWTSDGTRWCSC